MVQAIKVKMGNQIKSVQIVEQYNNITTDNVHNSPSSDCTQIPDSNISKQAESAAINELQTQLKHSCKLLNAITEKLTEFHENSLSSHSENIAKLAVEIARKILAQKISDHDYKIESIIQEALSHIPCSQDIVVHVNPADMAVCQQLQQEQPNSSWSKIQFTTDTTIAPAECLVATPKGSIKSCINDHLDQITKALTKGL